MMDENQRLMLDEALAGYGFRESDAELIRHNENMTFRIGSHYLLRIHKHHEGFTTGMIYEGLDRAQLYDSEIAFITHLKACGLNVQTPVPNLNGEWVTRLSDGTLATVLTWLEGHTVDKSELLPPLCYKIGVMTAKLHEASRSFASVPALRYDGLLCERLKNKLEQLVCTGTISREYSEVMTAALGKIIVFLGQTEDRCILVHSDLSCSNMLITEAGLAPIDFSLFGYCHPMMDISALFCCIGGSVNRKAIADGYRAAGGTFDSRAVDYTFALNVLLGIMLHCESWTKEDWFVEKLSGWCKNIFLPLTQDNAVVDPAIRVVCATDKDIPVWLALVHAVADDFPGLGLDEYAKILEKNIARQTALCVREDGKLAGILLFSPNRHCLSCMAVHPEYRHNKIASALISEMLRRMPEGDIQVTTFRDGDAKGTAPRALYRKFGFEPEELLTEFDYPVQRFVLHRKRKSLN
ncbi:MAG: N-acetyltransferase [Clostridiaceae bacterium]|nr:N-acetyltransferase [Clostridiaceae bacterium]